MSKILPYIISHFILILYAGNKIRDLEVIFTPAAPWWVEMALASSQLNLN